VINNIVNYFRHRKSSTSVKKKEAVDGVISKKATGTEARTKTGV
jgi:hypothetical protein